MKNSSSQLPKLLKMQMGTGKEAWSPVSALCDLNKACVYMMKAYSMHSPGSQCVEGEKSQGEASLERKGEHMMVLP